MLPQRKYKANPRGSYCLRVSIRMDLSRKQKVCAKGRVPRNTAPEEGPISALLAPGVLPLYLLLLLGCEVVLDIEADADLLGRLALDFICNRLAGEIQQLRQWGGARACALSDNGRNRGGGNVLHQYHVPPPRRQWQHAKAGNALGSLSPRTALMSR